MSNYHSEIMNVPVEDENLSGNDDYDRIYRCGHTEALHEAAQLGEHADCVIEELRESLKEIYDLATDMADLDNILVVVKIREKINEALKLAGS